MRKVKINEDRCKKQEDKELGVWEDDEINTLQSGSTACWNKCRKYRNSPALFIPFGTGLRLGELLALKWSKVDLEHRTIKIERTQTGIESEYVIPANSGRMVKESSVTSTFRAFCNYVGVEYKPFHTGFQLGNTPNSLRTALQT